MSRLILLFFFCAALSAQGQTKFKGRLYKDLEVTNSITKSFGDSIYRFHVKLLDNTGATKVDQRRYYWFNQGELKNTTGSFSGKVLHGLFEQFDRNGNLKEKGSFEDGSKTGLWLRWYLSGNLSSKYNWKGGLRNGTFEEYFDNGSISRKGFYKEDRIHKRVVTYNSNGEIKDKEYYRNGKIKEKKGLRTERTARKEKKAIEPKQKRKQKKDRVQDDSSPSPSLEPVTDKGWHPFKRKKRINRNPESEKD